MTTRRSLLTQAATGLTAAHIGLPAFAQAAWPYKPEQLAGVTMLAYSPHLLVALSKRQSVNVSSAGSGLQWQHVPFRGGAAAVADTAAGNTQLCLNGMVATMPLVQAGRLKIIGVSKRTRMALIGNVPTIAEQGVKDFESGTYQGIAIPASMPKAMAEKLAIALTAVIRSPEIRARLVGAGAEVMTTTPVQTREFLVREGKRWASVIERAGTQIEGNS